MIDQAFTFASVAAIYCGGAGVCGVLLTFAYVAARAMIRDM
jgi:hypothetical protein